MIGRKFGEIKAAKKNGVSDNELLQMVLEDVFDANKVDACERMPVFIANIEESFLYFAVKIHTLWGTPLVINPYNTRLDFTAFIGNSLRKDVDSKDKIVFIASRGALNKEHELLRVNAYYNFEMLDIPMESSHAAVANKLKDDFRFVGVADQIIDLLKAKKNYIEKESEFEILSKKLEDVKSELDEKAPEGIEKLREELSSAREERGKLDDQINGLKDQISKLEEEKRTVEKDYLSIKRFVSMWVQDKDYEGLDKAIRMELNHDNLLRAVSGLDFSYSLSKIYEFVMALNTTQIITLCGSPGSGKTTFVQEMAKALGAVCHTIEVQNNWTDRTDILGYYNPINQTYQSTGFLDALLQAKEEFENCGEAARLHIICLDEMNLSRIEYYFASFLSLLQFPSGKRRIKLLPDSIQILIKRYSKRFEEEKDYFELSEEERKMVGLLPFLEFDYPENVRIVGTMNVDQTTNFFSPKVIDRSLYIDFDFTRKGDSDVGKGTKIGEDMYFPASEFGIAPENSELEMVSERFVRENNRFKRYASEMWPLYKRINKDDPRQFAEELLLTKVLPKMTKASEYGDYGEIGFEDADARFAQACTAGSELEDDDDAYSFFGGN